MPDDLPTPIAPEIGSVIAGKYRVVRQIGAGGMGLVVEAENTLTGRHFAVKCMHPDMAERPEARPRFIREARAGARIRHPNVVDVYDLVVEANHVYIIMELLDGESLRAYLNRGVAPVGEVVALLCDAMRGVSAAHKLGIIHRDVKPDNIFIAKPAHGAGHSVKVLDFGLSKHVDDRESPALTRTGALMGTLEYMSREQINAQKDVDARTDVYAFGVILYEALAGRLPYQAEKLTDLILQFESRPPTPLRQLRSGLAPALEALVARSIATDRERRLPSLDALLAGLTPYAAPATSGAGVRGRRARSLPRWDSPPTLLRSVWSRTASALRASFGAVQHAVAELFEGSARFLWQVLLRLVVLPVLLLCVEQDTYRTLKGRRWLRTDVELLRLGFRLLRVSCLTLLWHLPSMLFNAVQCGLVICVYLAYAASTWWRARGERLAIIFMANPRSRQFAGLVLLCAGMGIAIAVRSHAKRAQPETETTLAPASTLDTTAVASHDPHPADAYLFPHPVERIERSLKSDARSSDDEPDPTSAPVPAHFAEPPRRSETRSDASKSRPKLSATVR